MPDPSLSPAIIEARAICPTNVFEIETLEIRHPDIPKVKHTLEVCFVVDTFSATSGYTTVAERVLAQVTAINSDLLQKYRRIKWALVTIEGASWKFDTGEYFVNFTQFLEAVATVIFTSNVTHGQIYEPVKEIVSDLNWSVGNDNVSKHIFYLGDTPNLSSSTIEIDWNGALQVSREVMLGSSLRRIRAYFGDPPFASPRVNPIIAGWQNIGQTVTISGIQDVYFPNWPTNLNIRRETTYYNRSYRIGSDGLGLTNSLVLDELDGTPIIPVGIDLTEYTGFYQPVSSGDTGSFPHPVNINLTGTHTVGSTDTPTLAIEALEDKGIIFNQLPTFTNTHLTSIVAATGGVSLSYTQLATPEFVRTNIVNSLSTVELIDSGLESIFLVNDTRPHSLPIETGATVDFETRGFKLRFAGSGENGLQNLSITIDDIDRQVSKFVAQAKVFNTPIELVFRVYLSDDLSQQQNNPPTVLYVTSTSNSSEGFSATATTLDIVNAPFPNAYYKLENFPLG